MRQYEGYEIGPILREIRKDKRLTVEDVADTAGISVSTLSQLEQGGRNLSMRNLYVLMDVYETDANTLLNLEVASDSIDAKLKSIPVHVVLDPKDVSGFGLSKKSDFMPEDAQTISKGCIRGKSGSIIEDSGMREEIDRALIRQFDLLPVARKMVMEELANGQQN